MVGPLLVTVRLIGALTVTSVDDADYGDYSIRAKLDDIEALPKPGC